MKVSIKPLPVGIALLEEIEEGLSMFFGEAPRQKSTDGLVKVKVFSAPDFYGGSCLIAGRDTEFAEAMLGIGKESKVKLERSFVVDLEWFG